MSLRSWCTFVVPFGSLAFLAGGCTANTSDGENPSPDIVSAAAANPDPKPEDGAEAGDGAEAELACGPSLPPDGEVSWKRDLGAVATLASSRVAADDRGNVFHARRDLGAAKFGPKGRPIWQKADSGVIAADRDGNAYVAGGERVNVSKLDPKGNVLWSRDLGEGAAQSLAVSDAREVLVSGPGLGTVKLDAQGNVAWTKVFGGHVAFGADGDVLVAGGFRNTVDLGGGPVTSRGGADAFIVAVSSSGNYRWSHTVGDADLPIERPSGGTVTEASDQLGQGIATGPDGDILMTGLAVDSVKLFGENFATPESPESGVLPLAFVVRFDRTGEVKWTRRESAVREMRGVAFDRSGNVILSGGLVGNAQPNARTWIEKLDASGADVWRHEQTFGVGYGDAVATDRCGNIFFSVTAADVAGGDVHSVLYKLRP